MTENDDNSDAHHKDHLMNNNAGKSCSWALSSHGVGGCANPRPKLCPPLMAIFKVTDQLLYNNTIECYYISCSCITCKSSTTAA